MTATLEVCDLKVRYRQSGGDTMAVDGASLTIPRGSITGIVGESGCGKTTLGRSIIGVVASNAEIAGGKMLFDGRDLATLSNKEQREIRWREIAFVPQSAMNSLNPVYRVGDQLRRILVERGRLAPHDARARQAELFSAVGLPPQRLNDFPHQFSGGMRQRVALAMALALKPKLIIADEPVTALDVLVQKQVLDLLIELRAKLSLSIILVTHDIGVIGYACDRVAVMYGGMVVEEGDTSTIFAAPAHPYTMGLLQAFPNIDSDERSLFPIKGSPPDLSRPPPGCRFEPRCPFAIETCRRPVPPKEMAPRHKALCWRADDADTIRDRARQASTWMD